MNEFWLSLDSFEKILWGMAIPASVIFIIQSVMTFMGMDAHEGLEGDLDGSDDHAPFQLFTFRNLVNFILGFSWMGISIYGENSNKSLVIFISFISGVVLVAIVMSIFYFMSKLEQTGNIELSDSLGCTGTVYIPITQNRGTVGKIQINVKGSVREYDAITDGEALKTGEPVVVKSIEGSLLVVSRK